MGSPASRQPGSVEIASSLPGVPVALLGAPFDPVTLSQAAERIESMVASRRPHQVVTANVDFLVQALDDVELRRILLEAEMVLCDGTPVIWVSRLLGNPLPERVAGADLVPLLLQIAAQKNYRLFFLGGAPEVTRQAVANLRTHHPKLKIAGHYSPPFRDLLLMEHEEIVARVRAARPDILLVSFGCPKAEKWIAMHYRSLGVPVAMGVGATIDFLADRMKRAPRWMQRSGMEWAFRLIQEPRRLARRYATDLCWFAPAVGQQWWHTQRRIRPSQPVPPSTITLIEPTWERVQVPMSLNLESVRRDARIWASLGDRHCLMDMQQVQFLDSTGVGLLIQLRKRLNRAGHCLILIAPSRAVRRALGAMKLTDFFAIADDAIAAHRLVHSDGQRPVREFPTRKARQPVRWPEEVTAANADEIWRLTQPHILADDLCSAPLVIDLLDVRFIDSTGAGLMVRVKKLAKARGVTANFVNAQPNVRNVLGMARLESLLLGASS